LDAITADLLVIALKESPDSKDTKKEWALPKSVATFDSQRVSSALAECVSDADFKGKIGSTTDLIRLTSGSIKRVVIFGLGKGSSEDIYKAAAFAAEKATGKVSSVALYLDDTTVTKDEVAVISEAANVAVYKDKRFKGTMEGEKDKAPPTEIVLVGDTVCADAVKRGQAIAAGISGTKDVVTAPANSLTPEGLADAFKLVAEEANLEINVLTRQDCLERKMGLYLGVTQGSIREPQFIHVVYKPQGEVKKKIAYVGKAVTHDTGGYNLKAGSGSMIAMMKWDMGGSGAVLGAAAAIGRIRPEGVEVHFIAPACENMISEKAIHPGDILTGSNGKTVEIINTDAEGRMCLADALVYAEGLGGMDAIIDIATLTGAIISALGHEMAGFWSPDDALAESISTAAKEGSEKIFRMPLIPEYGESLKSKCADLANIGVRSGSSIAAALFLKEFVKTDKWAHIDIAGTAWVDKKGGATGYGVKTMVKFAENITKS